MIFSYPLQLPKILQCAKEAGGDNHHFKAIQLPLNLVMLEAIKQKKLFQFALENNLSIMISASLMQGQVKQLCGRIFEELPPAKSRILQALQFVLSTPQICTAFCGMKTLSHWEENKQVLQEPSWSPEAWSKSCKTLGIKKED